MKKPNTTFQMMNRMAKVVVQREKKELASPAQEVKQAVPHRDYTTHPYSNNFAMRRAA
jgi:hypothetical protein